jgi:hypothetical protein
MEYWADYSAGKLTASQLTKAGYSGAIRYIDAPDRLARKHTSKEEFDDHRQNGLGQRLVFEVQVNDPVGGFERGKVYAQRAKAGADYLGYQGLIFFCADGWFSSTGVTPTLWRAYLDGAASILGRERVGAYGFADAMDAAVGHATEYWQAGARDVVRKHVHIWQDNTTQPVVDGIETDRNHILKPLEGTMTPDQEKRILDAIKEIPRGVWLHPIFNRRFQRNEFAETLLGSAEDRIIRQQIQPLQLAVSELRLGIAPVVREAVQEAFKNLPNAEADAIADRVIAKLAEKLAPPTATSQWPTEDPGA